MSLPFHLRFNYTGDIARRDLVAGATVAAIAIPQAMAYALIAGVDPRFGLYSAIVVTFVASIFGSSSHLINGPTNAISLVVFSALMGFDARFDAYQALFLLGIMVGVTQILIAVFKLGDLTRYISESVVLGFMAGAGLLVAIGQVGNFLGVAKAGGRGHSVLVHLWETLTQSGPFNLYAVGLGTGTLVAALLLRRVINRYRLPQMDMLLALIIASALAAHFGWSAPRADGRSMVSVVGTVPAALPSFRIPTIRFEWVPRLLGSTVAVSFLGLLEALAVAKSIATHTRQPLDYNRQCLAEGIGNLVGGFFQSLPGSGSLTRSAINYQSGAITRMSGIYASLIVGIAVLALGPYARFIPKPALAGLLFITAARLIDWKRLAYAVRASRFDAALVFITAFAAIFISVEDSILIGTAFSLLLFVPRVARLAVRELIVTPERVVRERQPDEPRSNSLLIYDLEGELFFGASPELDRCLERIKDETILTGIKYVVLRLRRTRNPDVVAVEHLERFLRDADQRGVTVLLAGVRPNLAKILRNVRSNEWFPADRIYPEKDENHSATLNAVRDAYALLNREHATERKEAAYYLV
ncbi:MAG: SulP family inorganic anion transporter [Verrucomicrobia bacterium]|nr:SulP family inorganic anion transporter [Verrucomicrobiota bacterium]